MVFSDIIFSSSLTATRNLNFAYIKWNPDVLFTGIFLDIVLGRYVRWGMGKKSDTKNPQWVLCCHFLLGGFGKYHPWRHVRFVKNKRLDWVIGKIKAYLGYYLHFLMSYVENITEATISRVSPSQLYYKISLTNKNTSTS